MYVNKYNYLECLELLIPMDLSKEYSEPVTSYGRASRGLQPGWGVYQGGYTSAVVANS